MSSAVKLIVAVLQLLCSGRRCVVTQQAGCARDQQGSTFGHGAGVLACEREMLSLVPGRSKFVLCANVLIGMAVPGAFKALAQKNAAD
jgi:hypothetical protein